MKIERHKGRKKTKFYLRALRAPGRHSVGLALESQVETMNNRQVILVSRPSGIPQADSFAIVEAERPAPAPGEVLVRNLYLSVEPAMRGWICDGANYAEPVAIGSVMRSLCVGEVVESHNPGFAVGDRLLGWFGWQDYCAAKPDMIQRRIDEADLPPSLALGVLGINGLTAYLALTLVGEPRPGDVVAVSTAAGGVGSAVGQIAKLLGCRTVGIAGGAAKSAICRDEFGFDAVIDYKNDDVGVQLGAVCPEGINIYFDNVAGEISDAVYPRLANGARIVVCGTASIAQWTPWPQGPRVERHLLTKRARMQGFVIFDHQEKFAAALDQLATWVRAGQLRFREDMLSGMDACPDALAGLYRGENLGKRIIDLTAR